MWGAGGPHRIPSGHYDVCARINELAFDHGVTCDEGKLHDIDIVYSARNYVVYAFCMRCMKQLPLGGRRPQAVEYAPSDIRLERASTTRR